MSQKHGKTLHTDGCYILKATNGFGEIVAWWPVVVITALVLTLCVCQAQCWGVETAGLPGPCRQTDGSTPARARSALGLLKRDVGIRRLVKDLEVRKAHQLTTQYPMLESVHFLATQELQRQTCCVKTGIYIQTRWPKKKHVWHRKQCWNRQYISNAIWNNHKER